MPGVTKKDWPLSREHFAEFVRKDGDDPNGQSKRVDGGPEGRFRRFSLHDIKKSDYKLDITWLRDEVAEDGDDLPEPLDLAGDAATELEAVVDELREIMALLEKSAELEEVAA